MTITICIAGIKTDSVERTRLTRRGTLDSPVRR